MERTTPIIIKIGDVSKKDKHRGQASEDKITVTASVKEQSQHEVLTGIESHHLQPTSTESVSDLASSVNDDLVEDEAADASDKSTADLPTDFTSDLKTITVSDDHRKQHLRRPSWNRSSQVGLRPNNYRSRDFNRARNDSRPPFWWSLPALMGVAAGTAIGIVMLILFKSIPFSSNLSGAQAASAPATSNVTSTVSLPGYTIWIYQIGLFSDSSASSQRRDELKANAIDSLTRGTSPIQLIAGVSKSKKSNPSLNTMLSGKSIDFYSKEWTVTDKKVTLNGVTADGAAQLNHLFSSMLEQADHDVSALESPTGSLPSDVSDSSEAVRILQSAGLTKAASNLQAMSNDLNLVYQVLKKAQPVEDADIQKADFNTAAFYIHYEQLMQNL